MPLVWRLTNGRTTLLNALLEDLPQLIITIALTVLTSNNLDGNAWNGYAGVNITTSVVSMALKLAEAHKGMVNTSTPTQMDMVGTNADGARARVLALSIKQARAAKAADDTILAIITFQDRLLNGDHRTGPFKMNSDELHQFVSNLNRTG